MERRRSWAILVLFLASALFWSAFEQAGSTLNLFAERNTNLHAWDAPLWGLFRASYFQALNSIFIIALAPVFAWLWVKLARNEPSTTSKFSWGLVFVGLGFAILIPVAGGTNVSPWWLTLTYLLHTIGELCLSPVGLSAMTKLAPARIAGLMMGVWFLSFSVGDFIGGRLASVYETFPLPRTLRHCRRILHCGGSAARLPDPADENPDGRSELMLPLWQQYRDQFPVTEHLVYLNHAAVAPLCRPPPKPCSTSPRMLSSTAASTTRNGWKLMKGSASPPLG